jgi:Phosphatidylinositol 3- and 4-kinase
LSATVDKLQHICTATTSCSGMFDHRRQSWYLTASCCLLQDERVMQLFGLVNTMLANDRATAERDLSIARYAVIPLSPNSGLIGWVPNTDTLHALIREYRDARKVLLNPAIPFQLFVCG